MNIYLMQLPSRSSKHQQRAVGTHKFPTISALRRCRHRFEVSASGNIDLGTVRRVLVLNAGSSSLKFKAFDLLSDGTSLASGVGGVFERIGDEEKSFFVAKGPKPVTGKQLRWEEKVPARDHNVAMERIVAFLREAVSPQIADEVIAVGHRVVHGISEINTPRQVDDNVLGIIKRASALAPLHNPPSLIGIEAAKQVFPSIPQVVVVDTAFHQTMPPKAFMYGLPYEMYEDHAIRKYGFHGTSHGYLVSEVARMLGKSVDSVNAITCHLGNGSSIAAIKNGKCIDTSMGMTPLEGLIMGTRCGDMDPAAVLYLQTELGLSAKETDTLLNKKSGLLGICGNNDLRSVIDLALNKGDVKAALALDMFVYRIRKYIGAYLTALGGHVDAIVFSAGIGENSALIRSLVCDDLELLGIQVDKQLNEAAVGLHGDISTPGSRIRVLVVPTDEELSIAQQALNLIRRERGVK